MEQIKRGDKCLYYNCNFLKFGNIRFSDMFYMVHIDEKWCYLTEEQSYYYLEPDEVEPHRRKRSITKLMFLVAVTRPQFLFTSYSSDKVKIL